MALRLGLCLLALAFPAFIAVAMYHGSINYPFWDHIEITSAIVKAINGTISLGDFFSFHNEHRPATYRALVVGLALLTSWNLQIELVVLWLIHVAIFLVGLKGLCSAASSQTRFIVAMPLLSALIFSPVAHNNQWWGMMIAIALASLFLMGTFISYGLSTDRRGSALVAFACATLATFSIANGVIAFLALAATSLIYRRNYAQAVFWILAGGIVFAVYLIGFPSPPHGQPNLLATVKFAVVTLGAPLAGLIWFPYQHPFDIPLGLIFPGTIGLLLVVFWSVLVSREQLRASPDGPVSCAIAMGLFAIGNALLTGYGRATFDSFGIAAANSSRYSTFNAYLCLSILLLCVRRAWFEHPRYLTAKIAVYVVALGVIVTAYWQSWRIFDSIHAFDDTVLRKAYCRFDQDKDKGGHIYPNPEHTERMIGLMRENKIGPYRNASALDCRE